MKLNELKIKSLKSKAKPFKVTDGHGLYIEVMPNGAKYWRMNYRFNDKQKRLAFGVYPRVTLKEAREKREAARKLLDVGNDPSEVKKLAKLEIKGKYANNFEAMAREWYEQNMHTWKPEHASSILRRLEIYIFPSIGYRPVKEVTPLEVLAAIRKIEEKGNHDLTRRLLQHCSKIFNYAIITGRGDRNPTIGLTEALKPAKTRHHVYLDEKDLPEFLKELELYDTKYNGHELTKLAFKLLILTFVRSGEIREAKWDEFNFDKAEWRIPAERMKMKTPHIVPLSKQSLSLLRKAKTISGENYSNYVFPSQATPRNCMSENTFLRAIELMGYKGKTVGHGFRSTASTILNENRYNRDVIERQLAHAERSSVRAAYNYAEYLDDRHKMMQWWADYLSKAGMKNA